MLSLLDTPWANGLANLLEFIGVAWSLYGFAALLAPKVASLLRLLVPPGRPASRRRALRVLADMRAFDRNPRRLISRIVQQVSLLGIIAGGLLIYRAMALPAAAHALAYKSSNPDGSIDLAITGLLEMTLGTALILIAADCAPRLRIWADPQAARARVIRRYLASRRGDRR